MKVLTNTTKDCLITLRGLLRDGSEVVIPQGETATVDETAYSEQAVEILAVFKDQITVTDPVVEVKTEKASGKKAVTEEKVVVTPATEKPIETK